mmetsp:Transcript_9943/g.32596  ORF Transcript_9943/g.32596 Transcript_9943/m.32596 type:complete len:201 (-) Transcript_9943:1108-1710(-)
MCGRWPAARATFTARFSKALEKDSGTLALRLLKVPCIATAALATGTSGTPSSEKAHSAAGLCRERSRDETLSKNLCAPGRSAEKRPQRRAKVCASGLETCCAWSDETKSSECLSARALVPCRCRNHSLTHTLMSGSAHGKAPWPPAVDARAVAVSSTSAASSPPPPGVRILRERGRPLGVCGVRGSMPPVVGPGVGGLTT